MSATAIQTLLPIVNYKIFTENLNSSAFQKERHLFAEIGHAGSISHAYISLAYSPINKRN
jgi:hypothetical protein